MSKPVVFNVLKGEFQSYEEFYGKEEHKKTKYKLFAGLGGGFGGAHFIKVEEFDTPEEADKYAYDLAVEEYEGYGGSHGLLDRDAVRNEMIFEYYGIDESEIEDGFDYDEIDEETLQNRYTEEIEGWIEWRAEKCTCDCINCDEEGECDQKNKITP